ncbi:O1020 protein, partial [Pitta sordida]|nr:O1020 protein [Pitta sordida]
MVGDNETFVSRFILLGFTTRAELQVLCFVLLLAIYVAILIGNLGVILLIRIDPRLHTPMYFFLSHLSFLDICYSSTIIPRSLVGVLVEKGKVISFIGCVTQLFAFATWATTEGYVLAIMAYDRHVAICTPLLYPVVMSRRFSTGMLAGAYLTGVISSTTHTISIFRTPFCSRVIHHFFCDGPPLLALSCSDSRSSQAVVGAVVGFNVLGTTVLILLSYSSVLSAVLRLRSAAGRHKALSTCASHLLSVALYYGSSLSVYLRPLSSHSSEQDKVLSVLYSIAVPLLNPLVYSLRNTDVKDAVRRVRSKI